MIFGLGAALGWGLADFLVAIIARRIGSFATVVLAQLTGVALFTVLLSLPGFGLGRLHRGLLLLPLIGVLGGLTYLAFYRALELGPIALVSPIAAGYAAIVIALGLLVLHESVPALALGGAAVTLVGVVLASTDLRVDVRPTGSGRSGVFLALLAMVGFGVGAFLIATFAKDTGWFGSIYLARIGSAATLVTIFLVRERPAGRRLPRDRRALAPALIGLLDIFGFASFARGAELGLVTITAAASVTYPLIPILGGVMYFGERPTRHQAAGVALVVVGLVLLAVGRSH